jgi:cytochrome c5
MVYPSAADIVVSLMANIIKAEIHFILFLVVLIASQSSLFAADNPRNVDRGPGITAVKSLPQNWTDEESNTFYNVPQGSLLVPYDWFLKLEQPTAQEPFRDPKHMRALGYITRLPDKKNPDGLPIGFTQDGPDEDGTKMLGLTCSACHTSQINHNGIAYLIDGGPSMANLERFLEELASAFQATATDNAKFNRFAQAVLPPTATDFEKDALRGGVRSVAKLRAGYNERNLPKLAKDHYGPGRIDAFGAIFNEVASTFLEIPGNVGPANAPVSFPCLWDTPQHERVQWNGAAENKTNPLGEFLVGTKNIGALGRNAGEVLGVFGHSEISSRERQLFVRYGSSVKLKNLIAIEDSVEDLWSPLWPEEAFGAINADAKARGGVIFARECKTCHDSIDRTSASRRVPFKSSDDGTDPNMNQNFGRTASTGRLEGRRKTLLTLERFGKTDSIGAILKHVVERSILKPVSNPFEITHELAKSAIGKKPSEIIDALNPGYRMTATIEIGDKKLFGQVDSLIKQGQNLIVSGGRFYLMPLSRNILTQGVGDDLLDLRNPEGLHSAIGRFNDRLRARPTDAPAVDNEPDLTVITDATAKLGYKSRPLNGVWATAPYLHNGSVPSLAELLKPEDERIKSFHIGSIEFDTDNVGFKDDPTQPVYDTKLDGNSNAGHKYGTVLSKDKKRDLLEYLKSL